MVEGSTVVCVGADDALKKDRARDLGGLATMSGVAHRHSKVNKGATCGRV